MGKLSISNISTAEDLHFSFGTYKSSIHITPFLPGIENITDDFGIDHSAPLLICDSNTEYLAVKIRGNTQTPICILEPGEPNKNWHSVETILHCAHYAGISRDGIFIGIGGGVVSDLCSFAASIYMRGCSLALISTSLLGMVDAALGGKTGFDLFGIKNIAGTFYPASHVYMPVESLESLPPHEWKSGMAELIKTAILAGDDFLEELSSMPIKFTSTSLTETKPASSPVIRCISRAAQYKGAIVEEDPLETGNRRILLNLGHTFGHALESVAGLGTISHGEAVAWGIARSCDLGLALGITPAPRVKKIMHILGAYGYETRSPHPLMSDAGAFMQAMNSDKKKRGENLTFIIPDEKSARPVMLKPENTQVKKIIKGE